MAFDAMDDRFVRELPRTQVLIKSIISLSLHTGLSLYETVPKSISPEDLLKNLRLLTQYGCW